MKLLSFYATKSEPCKALEGLLNMPEFEDIDVEYIDVHSKEGYDIVLERGLSKVPTLIKVCDDGAETAIVGLPSINYLAAFCGLQPTEKD
jgi:hypothetical protein